MFFFSIEDQPIKPEKKRERMFVVIHELNFCAMKLCFNINYHTEWGEHLEIELIDKSLSPFDERHRIPMEYGSDGEWTGTYTTRKPTCRIAYRYHFEKAEYAIPEAGDFRLLEIIESTADTLRIRDFWRPRHSINGILETALFTNAIAPYGKIKPIKLKPNCLYLSVLAPEVNEGYVIAMAGNNPQLGDWNQGEPLLMEYSGKGVWNAVIDLSKTAHPLRYKYCFFNLKSKTIDYWEVGIDRSIPNPERNASGTCFMIRDTPLRYSHTWKGTGVAIPVFSIRTQNGFGVGEFNDLKLFSDWCVKTGLKVIQILPVNETVASHSWLDSYPYKAISVMALHPIYLHVESLGKFSDTKIKTEFLTLKKELNANESVDYIRVMEFKSKYYKYFYDKDKQQLFENPDYQTFFNANKEWLVPYAVFSCLRDRFKTADFRQWEILTTFDKNEILEFASPEAPDYDDIAVHYYIQYHLHKQLLEAVHYAHHKGIAIKGDIPIGISRDSADAWTHPELFNLNGQSGAPPDDFAIAGQNWGFPTYKWEVMARNNYQWWKKRLKKMAEYFDAYRIDHILGFFRIWEIPTHATQGLLGYFNPALPLSREELHQRGLDLEDERYLYPYIHQWYLGNIFGTYTQEVIDRFLEPIEWEEFRLKEEFNTQRKITDHFKKHYESDTLEEKWSTIRDGLLSLVAEVLFIKDPHSTHEAFHPRIALHYTYSYQALDDEQKEIINQLYTDYYYHRHDTFWRNSAMEKLPALVNATNMLVCGEDLGMVPGCVPGVMDELGILSLEIQRMPKDPEREFGHPSDYPYRSVCSPSTHDMSTIRGWWEEDRGKTQRFFNQILGNYGAAPFFCEPWIAKEILIQHLYSPALLTIFPYQDIIATDGKIRWEKTQEERINIPSNPHHLWRYRMAQQLEDLLEADDFNATLREMIKTAGR